MAQKDTVLPCHRAVHLYAAVFTITTCVSHAQRSVAMRHLAGVAEGSSPYQNFPCRDHSDCRLEVTEYPSFCQAGNAAFVPQATDNTCFGCWACCLYPDTFKAVSGSCPSWCQCGATGTCRDAGDCPSGYFCKAGSPSVCSPCHDCFTDSLVAGATGCNEACPFGATQEFAAFLRTGAEAQQQFDYLAFSARDLFTYYRLRLDGTQAPVLSPRALEAWLLEQHLDLTPGRLEHIQARLDGNGDGEVSVQEFVRASLEPGGATVGCHSAAEAASAEVVFPGCPCNAADAPSIGKCPAGYVCSHDGDTFTQHNIDSAEKYLSGTSARCIACALGEYCPEGTYAGEAGQEELYKLLRQCEAGKYCPSAAEQYDCPPGFYCVSGSIEPYTCNYTQLVVQDVLARIPLENPTILERVYELGDPVGGNYCPEGSMTLLQKCDAGLYCPDVSTRLNCPKGFFCPSQSLSPRPCPWLTRCPEGTERPSLSFGIVVFLLITVVVSGLGYYQWRTARHQQAVRAKRAKDDELVNVVKTLIKRLQRDVEGHGGSSQMVSPVVEITYQEVGLTLKRTTNIILQGVTGVYAPGLMHAIMGPSGSGKTTFLNVLAGKASYGLMSGEILYNEKALHPDQVKKLLGFVPQDDLVHEDLTVEENVVFAQALRENWSTAKLTKGNVNEVLDDLYLLRVKDSIVGDVVNRGISGGQRKRVNIAIEAVSRPSILYLDEPTSGLDSTSSMDALRSLSKMAQSGMNIIMVIHQPRVSLYEMFDSVLLLGVGGRTVYLGPPNLSGLYFKQIGFPKPPKESIADFNLDVVSGKVARRTLSARAREAVGGKKCRPEEFRPESDLPAIWDKFGVDYVARRASDGKYAKANFSVFRLPPAVRNKLQETFQRVDSDGSGKLDIEELGGLFRTLNLAVSDNVLERLMDTVGGDDYLVEFDKLLVALEGDASEDEGDDEQLQGTGTMSREIQAADSDEIDNATRLVPADKGIADAATGGATRAWKGGVRKAGANWLHMDSQTMRDEDTETLTLDGDSSALLDEGDTYPGSALPRVRIGGGKDQMGNPDTSDAAAQPGESHVAQSASLRGNLKQGTAMLPPPSPRPPQPQQPPEQPQISFRNANHPASLLSVPSSIPGDFTRRSDASTAQQDTMSFQQTEHANPFFAMRPSAATVNSEPADRPTSSTTSISRRLGLTHFDPAASRLTDANARSITDEADNTLHSELSSGAFDLYDATSACPSQSFNRSLDAPGGGHPYDSHNSAQARSDGPGPRGTRGQKGGPLGEGITFQEPERHSGGSPRSPRTPRSPPKHHGTSLGFLSFSVKRSEKSRAQGSTSDSSQFFSRSGTVGTFGKTIKSKAELQDVLRERINFENLLDTIEEKPVPNSLRQWWVILKRYGMKKLREYYPTTVIDTSLLIFAACVIGLIHGTDWDQSQAANNSVMAVTTLATLSGVTFLRTFDRERPLFWREASSGLATLPYFLGRSTMDMYYVFLAPMLFVGPYWHLTLPATSFMNYYYVALATTWWSSGAAYLLSSVLPPSSTLVANVFLSLVVGAFVSGLSPTVADARGTFMEWILAISYSRWSMEAVMIGEVYNAPEERRNQMIILMKTVGVCGMDTMYVDNGDSTLDAEEAEALLRLDQFQFSDCNASYWRALLWMLLMGLVFRIVAVTMIHNLERAKKGMEELRLFAWLCGRDDAALDVSRRRTRAL